MALWLKEQRTEHYNKTLGALSEEERSKVALQGYAKGIGRLSKEQLSEAGRIGGKKRWKKL